MLEGLAVVVLRIEPEPVGEIGHAPPQQRHGFGRGGQRRAGPDPGMHRKRGDLAVLDHRHDEQVERNMAVDQRKPVRLDDFKGKQVVLYFYPRAMTPGCTIQACGIRDHRGDFTKAKTVVIGISPDKVSALAKFRERDQLNFDLLSDEEKTIAKLYGVWGKKKFMGREFMGVRRWTFIIDKNGKVSHIMDKVNTKSHHADVLGLL